MYVSLPTYPLNLKTNECLTMTIIDFMVSKKHTFANDSVIVTQILKSIFWLYQIK